MQFFSPIAAHIVYLWERSHRKGVVYLSHDRAIVWDKLCPNRPPRLFRIIETPRTACSPT